jgi:hypothetical protein
MIRVATFISHFFEPAIVISLAFLACSHQVGVSLGDALLWLVSFMLPTVLYRLWAHKNEGLDWDIHDRQKRIRPMTFLLGFLVIATFSIEFLEPRLSPILLVFLAWTSGFFAITALWTKISGHTGGNALASGMMVLWYGWSVWPLLCIVPLVGWARIVRKDHTLFQVILGAAYSWGLLFAAKALGY